MDYMTQLANRVLPLFKTPPRPISTRSVTGSELSPVELALIRDLQTQIKLMKDGNPLLTAGSEQVLAELIAEAMFRAPALARRATELLDWYPDYIEMLATKLDRDLPVYQQVLNALQNAVHKARDSIGSKVRISRGTSESDQPKTRQAELIGNPRMVLAAALRLGLSVPFVFALHPELEDVRQSRTSRLAMDPNVPPPPSDSPEKRTPVSSETLPEEPGIAHPARAAGAMDLLAVSLSGGGIRSATFSLGVLQGLAELDVLRRVDYLATVSGGGYIGGWLASLVLRHSRGIRTVQTRLSPVLSPNPEAEAARPIRFLREYSNYLTPRKGLLSADTWTMIAIWLRNTFLNQLVLVLFLAAVLLIARGPAALLFNAIPQWPAIGLAIALLLFASRYIGFNLGWLDPDTQARPEGGEKPGARLTEQWMIQLLIVIPVFLANVILVRPITKLVDTRTPDWPLFLWSAGLMLLFLVVIQIGGKFYRCFYPGVVQPTRWTTTKALVWITLYSAVAAAGCGGLLVASTRVIHSLFSCAHGPTVCIPDAHAMVLGPPVMLLVVSFATVIQIGLLGRNFPDERREWWSRLGAWVMIYSLVWLGLFSIAIYGPLLVGKLGAWASGGALAAWLGTATGGVLVARSSKTGAGGSVKLPTGTLPRRILVAVAPYVFILGLLLIVATGLLLLLSALDPQSLYDVGLSTTLSKWYFIYMAGPHNLWPLWLCLGFGALALLLAQRIDVNEFSMHHFYKNRLVRCYLGSTRAARERRPNRFTGFDPRDDSKLAQLTFAHGYKGPYPVLNTALNLVKGDDLAAQERKAASFVFTPKYSGFEYVDRRPNPDATSKLTQEGYRPTVTYGYAREKGIGLGTAVAISGAAASPNMGYHSSAAASFLMTMFNARLGWWLGNPRDDRTCRHSSPHFGLLYYLNDLLGNTTDRSGYVNLSDGGHFENLGVYELVRRRCRYIIACDAEQDGGLTFGALGNAVRKCRTDFGVNIILEPERIRPLTPGGRSRVHYVVGTIVYQDGQRGKLVYLKASLTGDEQSDVLAYAAQHPDFPHQSTANQWFDESQFESYRALGYHMAITTFGPAAEQCIVSGSAARPEEVKCLFEFLEGSEEERAGRGGPVRSVW